MSEYDHRHQPHDHHAAIPGGTGIAPGKRSLTQSLVPVQRSLRDQQREVVDLDAAAGSDVYDERATVEARPTELPLTDHQIRTARRKNPHWVAKLKVSAQIFSTAEIDTSAFALDVAQQQATHGLKVDGIAGPKTVAAVAGQVAAARSSAPRGATAAGSDGGPRDVADLDAAAGDDVYDERATVDVGGAGGSERVAHDDPFGMHLLAGN